MTKKRLLYFIAGFITLDLIITGIAYEFYYRDDASEEEVAVTQQQEQVDEPEQSSQSEFVSMHLGQTRSISSLGLTVTLETMEVLPCSSQPAEKSAGEGIVDSNCHMRHANVVLLIGAPPTDVPEDPTALQAPERLTFSSVPGMQRTQTHSFQIIDSAEEILRLIIREL